MNKIDLRGLNDSVLPLSVFAAVFFLLLIGLVDHKGMWYGAVAVIPFLFFISRNKFKKVALTLVAILPISTYGFVPRYGYRLFDMLALGLILVFLYFNSGKKQYYKTPLTFPLLLMFLTMVISSVVAPNIGFAVPIIVTCLLFYFSAKSIGFFIADEDGIVAILYCLMVPFLVSSILGVYQSIFGVYSARLVEAFNPNVVTAEFFRAPGPLDNSLSFGQYLSVMSSFFVGIVLAGLRYRLKKKILLILAGLAIFGGAAGLVGSLSRAAIISLVIVFPVSFLILYRSKGMLTVSLVVVAVVVFQDSIVRGIVSDPVAQRFLTAQSDFERGRLVLYENAFRKFLDNPILGVGTGNLNYASGFADPSQRMVPGGHVESVYVSYLVSNGILGIAALMYLILRTITLSFNLYRETSDPFLKSVSFGLFAAFTSNAVNMTTNPASLPGKMGDFDLTNFFMFWVFIALLMLIWSRSRIVPGHKVSGETGRGGVIYPQDVQNG